MDENQDSELKAHEDKQKWTTDTDIAETIQKSGMYERDEEIIPTIRTIKKVVEHIRYSPVEFRINEQDGRLAVRFNDFIITNGYSASYQNQMISAIKTFYRISGRTRIDLGLIERPRRSRALLAFACGYGEQSRPAR